MVGELLSSFVGEAIELGSPTPDQRIALLTARTDDYFAWVLRTRGTPDLDFEYSTQERRPVVVVRKPI